MPNLGNLTVAPLTAHHTTVAAIPDQQYAGHCLCGWYGDPRPDASAACKDTNVHEAGAR